MFAKTIIDSDAFLDMPLSAQALYFHLSMRADDDGFINNPKSIMRNVGCKEDDAKLLVAKKFIIPFESGVVVIKHWRIHNYIRKDTYNETVYKEEKESLELDENKAYRAKTNLELLPVDGSSTQVRLGKDSIGKDSIDQDRTKKETFNSLIDDYTDNPLLSSSLHEYVEMRKKNKGFTTYALKLNLGTLDKLSSNDHEKMTIVNQSIMNSWKSFYPLKQPQGIVQTWETESAKELSKEDHIEKLVDDYKISKEMQESGYDIGNRLENLALMYKDLTGRNIEEEENEKKV